MLVEEDLDDTHLCIKCSATIVGLDNYVQHRKTNCVGGKTGTRSTAIVSDADGYGGFEFPEPSSYVKTGEVANESGGKTSKQALNDPYDLPYELGADVFFSSLQLQSVQASTSSGTGNSVGKTSAARKIIISSRDDAEGDDWQDDSLMKVVRVIGETKKYEPIFQSMTFNNESPEVDRSEDEDDDINDETDEDDDDDENYVPTPYCGGKWRPGSKPPPRSGGKWKSNLKTASTSKRKCPKKHVTKKKLESKFRSKLLNKKEKDEIPKSGGKRKPGDTKIFKILPTSRRDSKWKPSDGNDSMKLQTEDEPSTSCKWKTDNLERRKKTALPEVAPSWEETDTWAEVDSGHPPVEHTKGKWVPGTKLEKLAYKEETIPQVSLQDYWCNICCRKLKTKTIYEKHLKSAVHRKKSDTETQLERAKVNKPLDFSTQTLQPTVPLNFPIKRTMSPVHNPNKRKRRKMFVKCEICKHRMQSYLMGKHLISHYHFVRRNADLAKSYGMVLDNIHQIVLQSPFQCSSCRFYANDEEQFLNHWNSAEHRDRTEGPGKFWCSFCQFECEDNNQMRRHLLGSDHSEIIMAINRSVPIIISKKVAIECPKCHQDFRYNIELRQHALRCEEELTTKPTGTASDEYQSKFRCPLCPQQVLKSKMALQRHEKFKHNKRRFYCTICNENFDDPNDAIKHRKTKLHREKSKAKMNKTKKEREIKIQKEFGQVLKCENCNHVSSSKVEAMLHEISHSKICTKVPKSPPKPSKKDSEKTSIRKCLYCKQLFPGKLELKTHLVEVHPEMKHICPLCGEAFILPQELTCHRRYKICVASTSKNSSAATIQKDPKKSWNCSDCTFSSAYEADLIFHRIIHTEGGLLALESTGTKIKCEICGKSFGKHSLRLHLRQHTNEKIFQCEICKRSFSRRNNYKEHMEYVHHSKSKDEPFTIGTENVVKKRRNNSGSGLPTDENFICDTCGKKFRTKYSLKMHINIHTGRAKKYECPEKNCQYVARDKTALRVHACSHEERTDLKCQEINCKYQGKSKYHLKRHMKNHMKQEKIYKCPECDFKAKIPAHIKRHLRTHTGECPYKCPHCDYSSAYVENLRKHILTTKKHPGKFIYECPDCEPDSQFKTNFHNEYQSHLGKVHQKSMNS